MSDLEQPPASGPTPESVRMQEEWRLSQAGALPLVRASAEKWRSGLLGLITLITAGLVVAGPEKAMDMAVGWRWIVVAGLFIGMLLVLVGLLRALRAAAGSPAPVTFEEFIAMGGDRDLIDAAEARRATLQLASSRRWAVSGIVVFLVSLGAWMISPTSSEASFIEVTTADEVLCGELKSGDRGKVWLTLEGESHVVAVELTRVKNLRVRSTCENSRASR